MVMIMTVQERGINSPASVVTTKKPVGDDKTTGLRETIEAGVIGVGHRAMLTAVITVDETGTHPTP